MGTARAREKGEGAPEDTKIPGQLQMILRFKDVMLGEKY